MGIFSTPTVVHFGCVLLASAVLLAPWQALWHATIAVGVIGLYGLAYVLRAIVLALQMSGASTGILGASSSWRPAAYS